MTSQYLRLYLYIIVPLLAAVTQALTEYRIHNACPTPVNLFIAGNFDSVIGTGGSITKSLSPGAGFFYTDAHGGFQNGSATRAGFFGDYHYYYIVKDSDHFNTGISIAPRGGVSRMGFCPVAECTDANCITFTQPPTNFPAPSGNLPPNPPLFSCPFDNISYDITIWHIHPDFDHIDKCLDVRGAKLENGTPVQIYDCNGTPAQNWYINRGSTKIQLANTNFCLDAGSNPGNGIGMKIWQCYDNLPAHQWWFTDDNRIALQGKGQCLDLRNGKLTNGNQVQTWQCTDFNTNQIWTL
ncbi:ricin B lectin domain-containing protein [Cyathus striatus]|nr:ricin B lectin domain-containing protein [Cyathus striatus]